MTCNIFMYFLFINISFIRNFVQASNNTVIIVSDKYGNIVYSNKTVHWISGIPVGNRTYRIHPKDYTREHELYFMLPRRFINRIKPANWVFRVLKKALENDLHFKDDFFEIVFATPAVGFIIFMVIGGIYLLFFPLYMIFLCIQCCCCSKNEENVQSSRGKRIFFSIILFGLGVLIILPAYFLMLTNKEIGFVMESVDTLTSNIITDILVFITNIIEQIRYIFLDLSDLIIKAITADVQGLIPVIGKKIRNYLNVDCILDAVDKLDSGIHNFSSSVDGLEPNIKTVKASAVNFTNAFRQFVSDYNTTLCVRFCSGMCSMFDISSIQLNDIPMNDLPDLDSIRSAMKPIIDQNIKQQANDIKKKLDTLPDTINQSLQKIDIVSQINKFQDTIKNRVAEMINKTDVIYSVADGINITIKEYIYSINNQEDYRELVIWILAGLFGVIGCLLILGVIGGVCGQDRDTQPNERGCISNTGGYLIIGNVYCMLLLGLPFVVLSLVLFMVGGTLQSVCEPIQNMDIFKKFVDVGGIPDFHLGSLMYNDSKIKVKVYDIAVGCRENKALYPILKMKHLFPIGKLMNFSKYIQKAEKSLDKIKSLNFSELTWEFGQIESTLHDFLSRLSSQVDLSNAQMSLNQVVHKIDQSVNSTAVNMLNDSMHKFIDICNKSSVVCHQLSVKTRKKNCVEDPQIKNLSIDQKASLQMKQTKLLVKELNNLMTVKKQAVFNAVSVLNNSLTTVITCLDQVKVQINNTINKVNSTMQKLKSNTIVYETMSTIIANIVVYLKAYSNHVLYLVYNDFGVCRLFWNIYISVTSLVCNNVVNSVNGFWCAFAIGVFFWAQAVVIGEILYIFFIKIDSDDRVLYVEKNQVVPECLSNEAMKKGNVSIQQVDEIMQRENLSKKQSDEVKKQSDEAKKQSHGSVRKVSLSKKQSDEVKKRSDEVKKRSDEVKKQSHGSVRKVSLSKKQSDEVKKRSDEVKKQSHESVGEASLSKKRSDEIKKQSPESIQEATISKKLSDKIQSPESKQQPDENEHKENERKQQANERRRHSGEIKHKEIKRHGRITKKK